MAFERPFIINNNAEFRTYKEMISKHKIYLTFHLFSQYLMWWANSKWCTGLEDSLDNPKIQSLQYLSNISAKTWKTSLIFIPKVKLDKWNNASCHVTPWSQNLATFASPNMVSTNPWALSCHNTWSIQITWPLVSYMTCPLINTYYGH